MKLYSLERKEIGTTRIKTFHNITRLEFLLAKSFNTTSRSNFIVKVSRFWVVPQVEQLRSFQDDVKSQKIMSYFDSEFSKIKVIIDFGNSTDWYSVFMYF